MIRNGPSVILSNHEWEEIATGLRRVEQRLAQVESRLPLPAELLTSAEVAEFYGLSRCSLYRHSDPKRHARPPLSRVKVGGATKWRRAEIEELLRGCEVMPPEPRGRRSEAQPVP